MYDCRMFLGRMAEVINNNADTMNEYIKRTAKALKYQGKFNNCFLLFMFGTWLLTVGTCKEIDQQEKEIKRLKEEINQMKGE